ncbi:MAG: transposase [Bacteriovoracaceae bacterium]|nr:transposase [Bacteriovoracaceae bacterium]
MKRKKLSADGLINLIRNSFEQISDHRGDKTTYSLRDSLLTSFAAFSLKYESFNSFFNDLDESRDKRISVEHLYQVKSVPSSTRLKEIIDPVATNDLRPVFNDILRELQRGKELEKFKFLDKYYLLALDGTQYYQSEKICCKKCLVKNLKNGKKSYSHQMLAGCFVHPLLKQVIPIAPEPIQNSDGDTKNDCERNASKRLLKKIRKEHSKLPIIVIEDGLASNAPHILELKENGMSFILGAKPGDHKYLFSWVDALDNDQLKTLSSSSFLGKKVIRRISQTIRYTNGVPLNDSNSDLQVNFLELVERVEKKVERIEHDESGIATVTYDWIIEGKDTTFSWVTDIELDEKNALSIMQAGRKRWSIENETFNTLKNQGYNFEHCYGHGKDNLATNFALLMMLAFLVDQVQELSCSTFQKTLVKMGTKKRLWSEIQSFFSRYRINSCWNDLLLKIAFPEDLQKLSTS